ncbi:hypothetical protein CLOLEP_01582 [[Clostridium] leptum DSM 753]|uniref:Uncharacterized protein n=1 Tax=[Clostridium] leptum DSM 753 TaxID=428125 RepID=A7VSP1_9FIRM|nr:hypothetical protein CLOLEP_01582 [[Clostridium] leptum DSM 753]
MFAVPARKELEKIYKIGTNITRGMVLLFYKMQNGNGRVHCYEKVFRGI